MTPTESTALRATERPAARQPDDVVTGIETESAAASTFSRDEKLSVLYWACVGVVGFVAVEMHPGMLVLLLPLALDVYRHVRTGRSAAGRLLEAAAYYRRLAERDRLAAAGTELSIAATLRQVAVRILDGYCTVAEGARRAASRDGAATSGGRVELEGPGSGAGAGHAAGHLLGTALGALSSTPSDIADIAASAKRSLASFGGVRLAYVGTAFLAGLLALLVSPLFAVALPALAVDYALWRWQGLSLVAELASVGNLHTPETPAAIAPIADSSPRPGVATHIETGWRRAA